MERLARVNRTQAFLGALALVLTGLFAPGWYGAVVLFALVAALLVVLVRTAPVTGPGVVAVRLVILAGVALIAVYKIL
jgi:asparagine N-glycosylation enzyme membrane subunit Stt3